MLERLRRLLGMGHPSEGDGADYDPVYGLPRRAVDDWLGRNPRIQEENQATLLRRKAEAMTRASMGHEAASGHPSAA